MNEENCCETEDYFLQQQQQGVQQQQHLANWPLEVNATICFSGKKVVVSILFDFDFDAFKSFQKEQQKKHFGQKCFDIL